MLQIKGGDDLVPKALWRNFDEVLNIPRPSKKEEKIFKFVKEFGEKHNLETIVDAVGNVIIRKPAMPGFENLKTVVLQAHLDMVPQKNSDKVHDFEKDPISAYVADGWVTADGTTLGADNGIGVAAMLALLEATDIEHGPIETLFTADEETGMTGAFGLEEGILKAEILLNLDSEEEGEFSIGSCGGCDSEVSYVYNEESTPSGSTAYKISVTGLKGGHSGADIHLGRGNSNQIMNRILWYASRELDLRVCSINGGSLRNAIPRESFAVVTIHDCKKDKLTDLVSKLADEIKGEFSKVEPDLCIDIQQDSLPQLVMNKSEQDKFLNAVYASPTGPRSMVIGIPDLVETSTNLARVTIENGKGTVLFLTRSFINAGKEDQSNVIHAIFELIGAEVKTGGAYPGWNPDLNSEILLLTKKTYIDLFKKEPIIKAIHAGLECGLFKAVYPDMDMISFGPTISDPHTPDERVEIKTVEMFWDHLLLTLKQIPCK